MGSGVSVSEMKKKIRGLWTEEDMNEVYSANLFYNNTFKIAEVREQDQRQNEGSRGVSFTRCYRLLGWDSYPVSLPILLLDVNFSFGGNFPITCYYLSPLEHQWS